MKELIKKLNHASHMYEIGSPIMSDKEWDDLYFQLKEMEQNTGIVYPNSPTQSIQYNIVNKLEKIKHNHKMLSLPKTKDLNEVEKFFGNREYTAMCKMDGLTCSLTYENGKLISAETRGNGEIGENIVHNARIISSIPQVIPYKDRLVIDGEIICSYDDFKEFQDNYKNPRNFAAGSIRLLNAKECSLRKLKFIAWDVIEGLEEKKNNNSFSKRLIQLKNFGFMIVPIIIKINKNNSIDLVVESLKESAIALNYPIDGIVFKFEDIEYGKSLGKTEHHFKNAIAYKFYDETYETELLDIEWTMGRTGILTPVAIFNPIDMEGSVVERASLHNLSIMEETIGIPYKGQKINVFKA